MKNLLVISAFAVLASTTSQAQTAPADCVNFLGICIPAHQDQADQTRRGEDDMMMAPVMNNNMDMPAMDGPAMEAPAAPGMMGMMN